MPKVQLVISDEINEELNKIAKKSGIDKGEVIRKALHLYVNVKRATTDNLVVGIADRETRELKREIVGV